MDCPECDARLLLVSLPSEKSTREAAAKGNPEAIAELATLDERAQFFAAMEASQLTDASALPELEGDTLDFFLTSWNPDEARAHTRHFLATGMPYLSGADDPRIVHSELAAFETIEPVERLVPLLEERYGSRFRYLRVAPAALYLFGDDLSLPGLCRNALGAHLAPGDV